MSDERSYRAEQLRNWRRLAAEQEGTLLFETAGEGHSGTSYLFAKPIRTLTADDETSLFTLFHELSAALDAGFYVAGLLRYEAGYIFERVRTRPPRQEPLAWFGVYTDPESLAATPVDFSSPLSEPLCLSMEMPRARYLQAVAAVKRHLAAGDTYQVNLTTAVGSSYRGNILDLYEALAEHQPAPFSALLHLPNNEVVLSFSPELFFSLSEDGTITVRPMKGTAALNLNRDAASEPTQWLEQDEKNRAEHLMIVDLLRSDLGRICKPGSIRAEPLFEIEHYRTLLQMTSTITGALRDRTPLLEVFRALFPSGSMTGAPKPRTMELIAGLEGKQRGIYSGAIGFAAPNGAAVFNVAIRTVVVQNEALRMGVGGGIVADSVPEEELAECWLKCEFLRRASPSFKLVETLLFDGELVFLQEHLDRLQTSADQLHFNLDRTALHQHLLSAARSTADRARIRVLLDRDGVATITRSEFEPWPAPLRIRLSRETVWSRDSLLSHKSTFRPLYDAESRRAQQAGFGEVIFRNERGELTEGAISSLLVLRQGVWQTPALPCGVLPGVARSRLLASGKIQEAVLDCADLGRADALALCNAIRGVAAVQSVHWEDGRTVSFPDPGELPDL